MAKKKNNRSKKDKKRISLTYHLDSPKDVALLEIVERAYKHSALADMGVSIGGFCKWLVGESLFALEMRAIEARKEELLQSAIDGVDSGLEALDKKVKDLITEDMEEASEESGQTEQPSE
jgi:hypothetical protein